MLWHRYFVATYEKALRDECGWSLGQPYVLLSPFPFLPTRVSTETRRHSYWDWSLDAQPANLTSTAPYETEIFDPATGFGGNGAPINRPITADENPLNITGSTGGGCVQSGPFVADAFTVNYPAPGDCLRRDFIPWIMNSFADPQLVDEVLAQEDYTSFARQVENVPSFDQPNIHGSMHFGVGGVLGTIGNAAQSPGGMSSFSFFSIDARRLSPLPHFFFSLSLSLGMKTNTPPSTDPLFYLHHGNLDRILWTWQQKDLATRLNQVGGPITPFDYGGQNVTLDFELNMGKLAGNATLKDLLNTEGETLCYTY